MSSSTDRPGGWGARPPDVDEVVKALTDFINGSIMARGRGVGPDDLLEAAGIDSMALLKILLFIETRFGFWMPDEDLLEANIRSPRAFAEYICRRGGPSSVSRASR